MKLSNKWKDYELIDTGDGEKLERWGNIILRRPDPQAIWPKGKSRVWNDVHGHYHRSKKGGGKWEYHKKTPKNWEINYNKLKFIIEPTGFKHTGIFPEQAVNWDWMIEKISRAKHKETIKVLNLFAYTGGASVACASAGAHVTHIDAAKGMVKRAKENVHTSGLKDAPVRFIVDDVVKFIQREIRRGNKYDGIIMDPPSFGRGPGGEVWKIEDTLFELIQLSQQVLSDDPLFFLINSYTAGFSPKVLENILNVSVGARFVGRVESGEIGIPCTSRKIVLPCGIYGRWESIE